MSKTKARVFQSYPKWLKEKLLELDPSLKITTIVGLKHPKFPEIVEVDRKYEGLENITHITVAKKLELISKIDFSDWHGDVMVFIHLSNGRKLYMSASELVEIIQGGELDVDICSEE